MYVLTQEVGQTSGIMDLYEMAAPDELVGQGILVPDKCCNDSAVA